MLSLLGQSQFDAYVSPTAEIHDAVAALDLALAEAEALIGHPLIDDLIAHPDTGRIDPVVAIVTDNGGPLRSFVFEALIADHARASPRAHQCQNARPGWLP